MRVAPARLQVKRSTPRILVSVSGGKLATQVLRKVARSGQCPVHRAVGSHQPRDLTQTGSCGPLENRIESGLYVGLRMCAQRRIDGDGASEQEYDEDEASHGGRAWRGWYCGTKKIWQHGVDAKR